MKANLIWPIHLVAKWWWRNHWRMCYAWQPGCAQKRVAWLEGGNGTEKGKCLLPFIVLLAVSPVFNWQAVDIWKGWSSPKLHRGTSVYCSSYGTWDWHNPFEDGSHIMMLFLLLGIDLQSQHSAVLRFTCHGFCLSQLRRLVQCWVSSPVSVDCPPVLPPFTTFLSLPKLSPCLCGNLQALSTKRPHHNCSFLCVPKVTLFNFSHLISITTKGKCLQTQVRVANDRFIQRTGVSIK